MPELVEPSLPRGILSDRPQPTLAAADLTLRPWDPHDVDALVAAYQDPAIQRWHVRWMTPADAARWIAATAEQWSAERGGEWAVVDDDGTLLGRIAFSDVDPADGYAEISYWTVAAARGRGVASSAVRTVAGWLLDEVGFHRLEIEHATGNTASCRVADRAGFMLEGTRRSAALHVDGWHDMHVHARLAAGGRLDDERPLREEPGHLGHRERWRAEVDLPGEHEDRTGEARDLSSRRLRRPCQNGASASRVPGPASPGATTTTPTALGVTRTRRSHRYEVGSSGTAEAQAPRGSRSTSCRCARARRACRCAPRSPR